MIYKITHLAETPLDSEKTTDLLARHTYLVQSGLQTRVELLRCYTSREALNGVLTVTTRYSTCSLLVCMTKSHWCTAVGSHLQLTSLRLALFPVSRPSSGVMVVHY